MQLLQLFGPRFGGSMPSGKHDNHVLPVRKKRRKKGSTNFTTTKHTHHSTRDNAAGLAGLLGFVLCVSESIWLHHTSFRLPPSGIPARRHPCFVVCFGSSSVLLLILIA